MATYKLQSFKQRAEVLAALAELNKKAEQLYERMLLEKFPVNRAYDAAQAILDKAEDLQAQIVWICQPTFVIDSANGVEYWHFDAGSGSEKIVSKPSSEVPLFSMLSSGDLVLVRNAEDKENNGIYTIDAVSTGDNYFDVTEGIETENADDETAEIVWVEKYYSE